MVRIMGALDLFVALKPVADRMHTQDNRATSYPLFVVEQRGLFGAWEFVTLCFTEDAANDYISTNKHNLKKTRIFVYSGVRNREIKDVIRAIRALSDRPSGNMHTCATCGPECAC